MSLNMEKCTKLTFATYEGDLVICINWYFHEIDIIFSKFLINIGTHHVLNQNFWFLKANMFQHIWLHILLLIIVFIHINISKSDIWNTVICYKHNRFQFFLRNLHWEKYLPLTVCSTKNYIFFKTVAIYYNCW